MKYYWLDFIRFVSAMMVVLTHARGNVWVDWSAINIGDKSIVSFIFFAVTRAGTEWVVVFFALSGLLVGGRTIDKIRSNSFNSKLFVIDRLSRIMVPLVPALIWSLAVSSLIGFEHSWQIFLGNIVGLQGVLMPAFGRNYPLWSLSYEIWFYVFVYGIAQIFTAKSFGSNFLAMALVVISFSVFMVLESVYFFILIIGSLSFWMYGSIDKKSSPIFSVILVLIGFAGSQITSASSSLDLTAQRFYLPPEQTWHLLLGVGVSTFLPWVSKKAPNLSVSVYLEKSGVRLARFSYSLYLTHYPSLYLMEFYSPEKFTTINIESLIVYLSRVVFCIVVAFIFYLLFEMHTARIKLVISRLLNVRRSDV